MKSFFIAFSTFTIFAASIAFSQVSHREYCSYPENAHKPECRGMGGGNGGGWVGGGGHQGGGWMQPTTQCSTSSRGLTFVGPTPNQAISQCKASPRTFNGECEANISCRQNNGGGYGGGWGQPAQQCSTSSRGLTFVGANAGQAVSSCKANARTSNMECEDNVYCGRQMYCSSSSRGYNFTGGSKQQAISACKASAMTSNSECERTAYCQ